MGEHGLGALCENVGYTDQPQCRRGLNWRPGQIMRGFIDYIIISLNQFCYIINNILCYILGFSREIEPNRIHLCIYTYLYRNKDLS